MGGMCGAAGPGPALAPLVGHGEQTCSGVSHVGFGPGEYGAWWSQPLICLTVEIPIQYSSEHIYPMTIPTLAISETSTESEASSDVVHVYAKETSTSTFRLPTSLISTRIEQADPYGIVIDDGMRSGRLMMLGHSTFLVMLLVIGIFKGTLIYRSCLTPAFRSLMTRLP